MATTQHRSILLNGHRVTVSASVSLLRDQKGKVYVNHNEESRKLIKEAATNAIYDTVMAYMEAQQVHPAKGIEVYVDEFKSFFEVVRVVIQVYKVGLHITQR